MQEAEGQELVVQLKRAMKAKKPYYFWFCPKAEDGLPVLLVDKKSAPLKKAGREARKTAQVKLSASGTIHRGANGLIFLNDSDLDGGKVERAFKTKLATDEALKKVAAHLRKARVVDAEEFAALQAAGELDVPEESEGSESDSEEGGDGTYAIRLAQLRELTQSAREVLGADHAAVRTLLIGREKAEETAKSGDQPGAVGQIDALLDQGQRDVQEAEEGAWNTRLEQTKLAFQAARDQFGAEHPTLVAVPEIRRDAFALRKAGELLAAFDRLDEIVDLCGGLSSAEEEEAEEVELDEGVDGDEDQDEEDEDEQESEEYVAAYARFEQAFSAAEERWDDLENPEDIEAWFAAAAAALDDGDIDEAQKLLDTEILWRLERAERNQQVAEEIGTGKVALAKVSLVWRAAQTTAVSELGRFKRTLLADEDVREDPRFPLIAQQVGSLDALLPGFGEEVAGLLDAVVSSSGDAREAAIGDATRGIERYRKALDAQRAKLASVDDSPFGSFQVIASLDEALSRLDDALSA